MVAKTKRPVSSRSPRKRAASAKKKVAAPVKKKAAVKKKAGARKKRENIENGPTTELSSAVAVRNRGIGPPALSVPPGFGSTSDQSTDGTGKQGAVIRSRSGNVPDVSAIYEQFFHRQNPSLSDAQSIGDEAGRRLKDESRSSPPEVAGGTDLHSIQAAIEEREEIGKARDVAAVQPVEQRHVQLHASIPWKAEQSARMETVEAEESEQDTAVENDTAGTRAESDDESRQRTLLQHYLSHSKRK